MHLNLDQTQQNHIRREWLLFEVTFINLGLLLSSISEHQNHIGSDAPRAKPMTEEKFQRQEKRKLGGIMSQNIDAAQEEYRLFVQIWNMLPSNRPLLDLKQICCCVVSENEFWGTNTFPSKCSNDLTISPAKLKNWKLFVYSLSHWHFHQKN